MDSQATDLKRTPLYSLHRDRGAKFVAFAGYEMPVQYPLGVLGEHMHTRAKAGLFDVSHMGQLRIDGADAAAALETLVPGDIEALGLNRQRYTLLTNDSGGIRDDLMVTNRGSYLFVVVNAGTKAADIAYLAQKLAGKASVTPLLDRALLALQGPGAAAVMGRLAPDLLGLPFMGGGESRIGGIEVFATRSGYTGEDGFELSVDASSATGLAELLLAQPEVAPIGLAARDSLRLEAGLCLYGHDIDEETTLVEADLAWVIGRRRREQGGFPGAGIILSQLGGGSARKRVGILPEGRAPAREGAEIYSDGAKVGHITSGGFGPSVNGPIAMGYVDQRSAAIGTAVALMVRGRELPARIVSLPFVPHRYFRAPKG